MKAQFTVSPPGTIEPSAGQRTKKHVRGLVLEVAALGFLRGLGFRVSKGFRLYFKLPKSTFCRVPIHSMLGFIMRTYKNVGYGSLR